MAISFVGAATGITSVTMPAHITDDFIVAFAFRDGSNTPPTVPGGWTPIDAGAGANSASSDLYYKKAASSGETSGTWTNATALVVGVYRGQHLTTPIGGIATIQSASSTTITYGAVTFTVATGSSWGIGAAGHRSINTALETPPTGMTNRADYLDAIDEAVLHDTNGGVTGWSSTSVSAGGTAAIYRAHVFELIAASGSPYTLTASPASFTFTGIAAGLRAARILACAKASFTFTGVAAGVFKGFKVAGAAASFALTGVAATLRATRTLPMAVGSFALSGIAAGLRAARVIPSSVGTFNVSGISAGLLSARRLTSSAGSFSFTGIAANLVYTPAGAYVLTAAAGAFTFTGRTAGVLVAHRVAIAAGAFSLTGVSAGLRATRTVSGAAGAFTVNGVAAGLRADRRASAGQGTFTLTGQNVSLRAVRKLTGATGSYLLTGKDVVLTYSPLNPIVDEPITTRLGSIRMFVSDSSFNSRRGCSRARAFTGRSGNRR
jgi:hypothetical protein